MTETHWALVAEIFAEARQKPGHERSAYLAERCAALPDVLEAVERLIAADAMAGPAFLDLLDADLAANMLRAAGSAHMKAGPYRLVREIGRGGMGEVYLGERDDGQFERQVAIKLVKRGMDSDAILRRFLHERQILARLDHPHIARLYDGGVTDDGRPFFAMELVEGQPITRYCDERMLDIDTRLRLFCDVCDAAAYAHQNLVIHRDLKPSNIVVTGDGKPRLLDFGIAKLLDVDSDPDDVPRTDTAFRALTPEYAAPEQLLNEPVTTSADVYALGVVLYELLTGQRPRRVERWTPETWRALDQNPMRPSLAAAGKQTYGGRDGAGESLTPEAISRARNTTPQRLHRRLAGDLDTVLLKALAREPQRRYSSPDALRDDIERHLALLPVNAHGDTIGYRTVKFLRRHTMGVVFTTAVMMLVIASAIALAFQQRITAQERDRAQMVRDFALSLFEVANPVNESGGDTITARTLLERGVARIDEELAAQPDVQAQMLSVVGAAFRELGNFDRARPLFERALALRRERFGEEHMEVARSLSDLGQLMAELGQYDEAELLQREALDMRRKLLDPDDLELAASLNRLGVLLRRRGQVEEPEELYREALAIRRRRLNAEHPEVLTSQNNLAMVLQARGEYDDAEALHREVLAARRRVFGEEHVHVAISLNNLGTLLYLAARYEEAAAVHREALAMQRKLLGDDHPDVLLSLNNLAGALHRHGDLEEAESLLREVIEEQRRTLGAEHPRVLNSQNNLANLLAEMVSVHEAEALYRDVLARRRRALGSEHPEVATTLHGLGQLLIETERPAEAEAVLREALEIRDRVLPRGAWQRALAVNYLGASLSAQGRHEEAEPLLLEGFTALEEALGEQHVATLRARHYVAAHYLRRGQPEKARLYGEDGGR